MIFKTDISKIKDKEVEAFYLSPASGKDGGLITKQIRELGFKQLIVMNPAPESVEFSDTAEFILKALFIPHLLLI